MINPTAQPLALQTDTPLIFTDDRQADLPAYLAIIIAQRWLIAGIALALGLAGVIYAYMAKPVYEANLLVHVEEKGQREPKNILGEAGSMIDYKTPAAAEIELLRSRMVVAQAIDNLRLYIHTKPQYLPMIGSWLAKLDLSGSVPWLRGLGGYAWGKEHIDIAEFNLPAELENHEFILRVQKDGWVEVSNTENDIFFTGKVGETINHLSNEGTILLKVAKLYAYPGTEFTLTRSSRLAAIEGIQQALSVNEMGKQSGVLSATLKGDNAVNVYQLLTEISKQYMAQNGARRTEEADKSLAYLNQRLPELKLQLEQAEARYNQFRNTHGTVDLGEEAKINLQRSAAARTRRIELEQKRTELLTRYTANHPAVEGVDAQLREVGREIREANSQVKSLPVLEQELVRLARDVKVNSELYAALVSSAQQLQLIAVGKTSNVRLIDAPIQPERPVSPNRPRIIAIALFAGLFLGVLAAFIKRALQNTIDEPEQVEKMFGLPVYASIPRSKQEISFFDGNNQLAPLPLLARVDSMDVAIESLRSLRAALQFSMTHARNNIVLITGPTTGMGKSFISANLAAVMAASGKKILLIDADLRDGHLHRYFNLPRQSGLSDLLAGNTNGNASYEQLIRKNILENLDFISTGSLPPHPSELLLRPTLQEILLSTSRLYDMIIIDATPLLAVADSLILGTHAGAIFLVARAGQTTPADIAESLNRLARAGLSAKGVLFNDITMRPSRYGYGYRYGKFKQLGYTAPTNTQSDHAVA
jgi:tyrosine-protein kinase Etk/Wzc